MAIDRILRTALAAASVASATACGPRISSDRDESIPIPQGATWAWGVSDTAARFEREPAGRYQREPMGRYQHEPAFNNEILLQRYQRSLDVAMQAKGFRKVDNASQADFLLTLDIWMGARRSPMMRTTVGVGFGWYGGGRGWYNPWGRGRYYPWGWGLYDLWGRGLYYPWGWGLYDQWACCGYGPPMWGGAMTPYYPAPYWEGALLVLLRQRSTGHVAWRGTYPMDVYETQRVSQAHVQKVVDKLFEDLR